MNKVVCVVGMPGSGKTALSDYFARNGYHFIRFGQTTIDEVIKRGLKPNEKNQKEVREDLRKKYGSEAVAKINLPIIQKKLKVKNVVIDGLYSWSEYKFLKERLESQMIVVSVFSPPHLRHNRLSKRRPGKNDKALRNHHFSIHEAQMRDYNEIEKIEKGGPIAMADFTILNTESLRNFENEIQKIFKTIEKGKAKKNP